MNLELLFEVIKLFGDFIFYYIVVNYVDCILKEYFCINGSCYYVIDYSLVDGMVWYR